MYKFLNTIIIQAAFCLFLFTSCEDKPAHDDVDLDVPKKISIVTTTTQITDIVSRLVGDFCKVKSLMGPGTDPHSYKPTAHDITALSTADLVVYHGLKFEGKLASILSNQDSKVTSYAICSAISNDLLLYPQEDNKTVYPDPHVWFSPKLWLMCIDGVSAFLIEKIPEFENVITARKILMKKEMEKVSTWALTQLQSIPEKKRILITSHDAFRYLGDHFGLEVIALQGISTLQEAGLNDRTSLVDFIKNKQVDCLFIESSVNPKALKEIAKETGTQIGAPLFSDAFGSKEKQSTGPSGNNYPHDTWEGMLVYNISAILRGLNP